MDTKFDICLDVRGEESPIPMIKVDIVCQVLDEGEVLKVMTNSEGSKRNIENLVGSGKWELVHRQALSNEHHFYIRKPQ